MSAPLTVTLVYASARKSIYRAGTVEVRRNEKQTIACMKCARPACPHVNAVRVHLGLPPLPAVRYADDERPDDYPWCGPVGGAYENGDLMGGESAPLATTPTPDPYGLDLDRDGR